VAAITETDTETDTVLFMTLILLFSVTK